jgi:2-haloacid dehalogenase
VTIVSGQADIEAVVFDVGGVLVEWDMRVLLRKLYPDEQAAQWAFENVVSLDWHFAHDCGRELGELVAERSAEFPSHAHAIEAYATRFLETIPGRVPGTAGLVDQLAARGVPLYAITNFPAKFWDEFHPTEPVLRHFRDVVVSGKVRRAKPDPAIFELAERRFGHPAEAMLFIDDSHRNVEAARARGWQAHHFTGADRLAGELRERGLID